MLLQTSQTDALLLIKACPPIRDRFTVADDIFFNQMLQDSAATGVSTVYRWRYVAARFLQVSPEVQLLDSAEGAKFTRLQTPIRALLGDQVGEDNYLIAGGWTIPAGWEAIAALNLEIGSTNSKRKPVGSSLVYKAGGF